MKVVVLTTSYPRGPDDVAGAFVRDAVEHLRAAGVDVHVVSPASFRHFGLAYGHGIVGNLKRRPWKVFLVPLFLASYSRAARRAAKDADIVHAHWLPSAIAALGTGKPFVVQLWGTDVELARRAPWAFGWLLRRARLVLCPSQAVAAALPSQSPPVWMLTPGVTIPERVGEPDDPPHVLFVGRLSEEKGSDPQMTLASEGHGSSVLFGRLELLEHAPDLRQIHGPGRRQLHLVVFADEQRKANLRFELLNLTTERRLRHVQTLRGSPEMQFLGDGHEIAQMSELHAIPPRYRTRPNRS